MGEIIELWPGTDEPFETRARFEVIAAAVVRGPTMVAGSDADDREIGTGRFASGDRAIPSSTTCPRT